MCFRSDTRDEAARNAAAAAARPPGRAPKLAVCLPPWHAVGQPYTVLQQAYGGLWNVPASIHGCAVCGLRPSTTTCAATDAGAAGGEELVRDATHPDGVAGDVAGQAAAPGKGTTEAGAAATGACVASGVLGLEQCMHELHSMCDVAPTAALVLVL